MVLCNLHVQYQTGGGKHFVKRLLISGCNFEKENEFCFLQFDNN